MKVSELKVALLKVPGKVPTHVLLHTVEKAVCLGVYMEDLTLELEVCPGAIDPTWIHRAALTQLCKKQKGWVHKVDGWLRVGTTQVKVGWLQGEELPLEVNGEINQSVPVDGATLKQLLIAGKRCHDEGVLVAKGLGLVTDGWYAVQTAMAGTLSLCKAACVLLQHLDPAAQVISTELSVQLSAPGYTLTAKHSKLRDSRVPRLGAAVVTVHRENLIAAVVAAQRAKPDYITLEADEMLTVSVPGLERSLSAEGIGQARVGGRLLLKMLRNCGGELVRLHLGEYLGIEGKFTHTIAGFA